ncbi:putative RNA-directed DNA polymerase from mobile element jockey-like [Apostichopus japonicus]|uniref:Putative RNA-directed DNA polymerase from mobile element jockey-like n=1 Tax=Stichopus japonicus TaxID=307972 RepID=A0A2G8K883_STIJA|nr:putative RNA-directed DNA polymerase from mobile element jockey-like [Apostichopus japonicus]
MVCHFSSQSLIRESQHGFVKKGLVSLNILEFMEDVTSSLNRQKSVDVVLLDFQKVFDKAPHQRRLLRLKSMGVNGNLLSWVGNWLGNTEQRVVIKGCASSWQDVTSGVPQGSVLGPLLFVAYINDIDADILCTAKKFADDTKLYSEVSSKSDSEKSQTDLDNIFVVSGVANAF